MVSIMLVLACVAVALVGLVLEWLALNSYWLGWLFGWLVLNSYLFGWLVLNSYWFGWLFGIDLVGIEFVLAWLVGIGRAGIGFVLGWLVGTGRVGIDLVGIGLADDGKGRPAPCANAPLSTPGQVRSKETPAMLIAITIVIAKLHFQQFQMQYLFNMPG